MLVRRTVASVLALFVLFTASCAEQGSSDVDASSFSTATPVPADSHAEPVEYELCAEFPGGTSSPADLLEGWWNSAPADPVTGDVIQDPALWRDERMREHPRVAIVNTDTGEFVTWDRMLCGQDPSYKPVVGQDWPASSLVVIDMDSNEVLSSVPLDSITALDGAASAGEGRIEPLNPAFLGS